MSLAELVTYARRNRLRIGLETNARRREPSPAPRMTTLTAWNEQRSAIAFLDAPGGFAELERAAAELLELLRDGGEGS